MRLSNATGWSDFTYNLWYPGILGSMLYDLLEVLRSPSYDWFFLTRVSLVILYVLDYLHAYIDIDAERASKHGWLVAADTAVAFLFGYGYWSMTREDLASTGACILIAAIIILLYPGTEYLKGWAYHTGKVLFLLAAIGLVVVTRGGAAGSPWIQCWWVVGCTAVYAVHVFGFTELSRRTAARKG